MVRIRFAEISGLYSYGEKSRIDFGEKTLIVGPNNAGKSSIFKALKFFIKSLAEFDSMDPKPWDWQDVHEMTVGFELDDAEARYTAETLSVNDMSNEHSPGLALDTVIAWLTPKVRHITLTIRWNDVPFQPTINQIDYFLYLEDLNATVCSRIYNGDVWVTKHPKPHFQYKPNLTLFPMAIKGMLDGALTKEKFTALLSQEGARISGFPVVTRLMDAEAPALADAKRIQFVVKMSGNRTPTNGSYSFFVMFGYMLKQRFAFVSEQRNFLESNDIEKLPLKDDGSNLQSFLFWLQNGGKDEQTAYFAIQNKFSKVAGSQNISFRASITEREELPDQSVLAPARGKILPDKATVLFAETLGQRPKYTDFTLIGAGIKEILFLLTKCFECRDRIILMDEPATNLHPVQIKRLIGEILAPNEQNGESGQVVIITHSSSMASLEMLSAVNVVARVNRTEYSHIVQPVGEDKKWIVGNLETFHLLKSDILFAKKVVLVEGWSDKIFLESIINHDSGSGTAGDDIVVLDVGGSGSFKKFRKFLEIFKIPFAILADNDAKNRFGPDEVLEINHESLPLWDGEYKIVYLLEKDLEYCLNCLAPKLYKEIASKYKTKPERAYHFVRRFFAENGSNTTRSNPSLRHLKEMVVKDSGYVG